MRDIPGLAKVRLQDAGAKGVLARNTIWMSFGQVAKLVIQAAYFVVMAKSLGVKNYGAFVGVVALIAILYPLAPLGRGDLLVRNVARDKNVFRKMWGKALATTGVSGLVLAGLAFVLAVFVLPKDIPLRLVALVALSDLIGLNLITIAGQAFQAFERLHMTALINFLVSACRLTAALLLCSVYRHPSALDWGYVYLASTVVVVFLSSFMVAVQLGLPKPDLPRSWIELKEGIYFSISLSAQSIYNDIDKTMLARLSSLSATGIYGAAYRIIDVSLAPVFALLYSSYPGMFRKGAAGIESSVAYARPLLIRSVGYGLLIGCCLLLVSNALPLVLGLEYKDAAEALRWLAPLPALKATHYFLSNALAGAGHQGIRSAAQVSVAAFNVGINLWIIPRYSWRGAAWSSIASDALLACAIAACVFSLIKAERAAGSLPILATK